MSTPWLPPYLGSYEQLVQSLLHDPFLGSGRGRPHGTHADAVELNPQPLPPREFGHVFDPEPSPWKNAAVRYLANLVSMQVLAHAIPDQGVSEQIAKGAESSIAQFLDDYCGTPPQKIPWPWPGPPPWDFVLASELVAVANTMQPGEFREGLTQVAGRIVQKGFQSQRT